MNILNKYITQGVIFIAAYMAPLTEHALVILILLLIDFITGVWASWKLDIKLTSNRMKRSVTKFIIYGIALFVGLLLAQTYGMPWVLISISFFIASVEVKSISENMLLINPEFNLFKVIKESLSSEKSEIIEESRKEKIRKQDEAHHKIQ